MRDAGLSALMGTVVENAMAGIVGTKFRATGPLLITDWGMSGPAILKLSSYAARYLADNQYNASLLVSWLGEAGQEDALSMACGYGEGQSSEAAFQHLPGGVQ